MTKEERIIATAYTGIMFIDGPEMELLYEYMEKKVGHGVIDLMLTSKKFWEELHKACEQDFIDMVSKEPSEVDLEKEINNLDNVYFDLDGIAVVGATYYITVEDLKDIARHFFELGLNAKKK